MCVPSNRYLITPPPTVEELARAEIRVPLLCAHCRRLGKVRRDKLAAIFRLYDTRDTVCAACTIM